MQCYYINLVSMTVPESLSCAILCYMYMYLNSLIVAKTEEILSVQKSSDTLAKELAALQRETETMLKWQSEQVENLKREKYHICSENEYLRQAIGRLQEQLGEF